jgi:hypothetical protein
MSRADGILHCVVYARIYDMIERGEKPVEYRDAETPVGRAAMRGGFHTIRFQRAYQKEWSTCDGWVVPTMLRKITHIDTGHVEPKWTLGVLDPDVKTWVRIWFEAQP